MYALHTAARSVPTWHAGSICGGVCLARGCCGCDLAAVSRPAASLSNHWWKPITLAGSLLAAQRKGGTRLEKVAYNLGLCY